jgi:thiol-disulfide isomerase/thioredoxin
VPSPEQALRLTPVQPDVEYSRPADVDVPRCKVIARRTEGAVGWVVEDPAGLPLRRFLDTNGDNKVDQWSYFKDGLEVYRDIDADYDGKADQYRWFNTAGSRWAIDRDEDGLIDAWQSISAEEVTAEVIAALANQDAARFARVALNPDDLKGLGLGPAKNQDLAEKIATLGIKFKDTAARAKGITEKTRWVHFSGSQPGIVPAGTEGSTKDVQVYENVVAIAQTGTDHVQIQIGTLVKVGDTWKVIDVPQATGDVDSRQADTGYFFRLTPSNRPQITADVPSEKMQEVLTALQKLDAAAQAASPEEQARYHAQRADLLQRIADEATKPEDRAMWLRQLADMLGAAVQSGAFPDGVKRLEALFERVRRNEQDRDLAAHVRFVELTAQYGLSMQAKGADFAKIQSEWLKTLEQYVADYPKGPDAAEAMLQLAIAQEFAGREEEAKRWYGQIVAGFSDSPAAQKAAGAKTRLESVGKVLALQGKSPTGATVDLAKYRGQVVLIQYWASWCEPCKADMATLKEVLSKHGRTFAVIGVNLDNNEEAMAAFLKENPLPWSQIFEPGGLESRPAVEMGILTLPTMILVDQEGRVVNRNITAVELEAELKRLIK